MRPFLKWFGLFMLLSWTAAACAAPSTAPASEEIAGEPATAFQLTSDAFAAGDPIPARYTCSAEDISPPLQWTPPPAGTQSLALIMDDPDAPAGAWVHWVLFNLPPDTGRLPEQAAPPAGSVAGNNSWGRAGYGGPCPPAGAHRYFFKLYALDAAPALPPGATKAQVINALKGHILAQTELMGTYAK